MSISFDFIFWVVVAYILGSIPWSVWLSIHTTRIDPRSLTDGNPGAANAFRAAGRWVGIAVLLLDFFKAFMPVAIVYWLLDFPDWQVFWVALAPMIGHAFSVFLRLRGGRGLTTMFGVWSGLTLYIAPLVMGFTAVLSIWVIKNDEVKTLLLPIALIVFLLLTEHPAWMIGLAVVQLLVLIIKIGPYYFYSRRRFRPEHSNDSA